MIEFFIKYNDSINKVEIYFACRKCKHITNEILDGLYSSIIDIKCGACRKKYQLKLVEKGAKI